MLSVRGLSGGAEGPAVGVARTVLLIKGNEVFTDTPVAGTGDRSLQRDQLPSAADQGDDNGSHSTDLGAASVCLSK
jgi:hypothetical protein